MMEGGKERQAEEKGKGVKGSEGKGTRQGKGNGMPRKAQAEKKGQDRTGSKEQGKLAEPTESGQARKCYY
jgi:hypothetical protein